MTRVKHHPDIAATVLTHTIKPLNEDAGYASPTCVLVVDGATPVDGDPHGNEKTSAFSSLIAATLGAALDAGLPLHTAVTDSLTTAVSELGRHNVTGTLSVAAVSGSKLHVGNLGDSSVIVFHTDGSLSRITSPDFLGREDAAIEQFTVLRGEGGDAERALAQVSARLADDRKSRNTDDGQWVLSDCTPPQEIVSHMHVRAFDVHTVAAVMAVSDGAQDLIDTFGVCDSWSQLAKLTPSSWNELVEQAYARASEDPDRVRYPRLSNFDDATVATLRRA